MSQRIPGLPPPGARIVGDAHRAGPLLTGREVQCQNGLIVERGLAGRDGRLGTIDSRQWLVEEENFVFPANSLRHPLREFVGWEFRDRLLGKRLPPAQVVERLDTAGPPRACDLDEIVELRRKRHFALCRCSMLMRTCRSVSIKKRVS